ncbi:MAG: GntR family transcriptional regulator [Steroidobacteraceae bacterium]
MLIDCCTYLAGMAALKKTNKSVESVLVEIRTGIQRGRYAPGQRLVTSELAEHLGTSLAPVREALHILVGEGVVDIRPNIGASVMTLSPQTFIDGLEILEVTGALALRLIAPKLKDAKVVADIERALKPVFDAGKRRNPHDFFSAIAASHRLVNDYAGNAYLNPILNRLHLEYFYRQMADCLPDDFWDAYTDNYRITGKHLINGDARAAERAWRKHVKWVIGLIRKRKLS